MELIKEVCGAGGGFDKIPIYDRVSLLIQLEKDLAKQDTRNRIKSKRAKR